MKVLEQTFQEITKLGKLKGGEYSGDHDRLANFRRNGLAMGLPKEAVLMVYAAKHWDSLMQFVHDEVAGKTRDRLETLEGRIDDIILYMILLKCMLIERNDAVLDKTLETKIAAGKNAAAELALIAARAMNGAKPVPPVERRDTFVLSPEENRAALDNYKASINGGDAP